MRDDARLPRAGAREDQQRAIRASNSFLLLRVERGEKIQMAILP
jgi:hypothetical protein